MRHTSTAFESVSEISQRANLSPFETQCASNSYSNACAYKYVLGNQGHIEASTILAGDVKTSQECGPLQRLIGPCHPNMRQPP
ncbi:hypothetical protein CSPX01_04059 [Colletotrichum filicis]|nr:hypothetical protein CSPX01_04059 [Colletotrichum filicis]